MIPVPPQVTTLQCSWRVLIGDLNKTSQLRGSGSVLLEQLLKLVA
jgi:hypothetical protein